MSDKWKIQKLDNDCNCNRCKYIPEVFALLKAYPHTNMHHNTIADIFGKEDAEYIVKAVNEYDRLVAEVEKLKFMRRGEMMLKDHKYCIYCGFELDKNDDGYCHECGKTNKYLGEYPALSNEIEGLKQKNEQYRRRIVKLQKVIKIRRDKHDNLVGLWLKQGVTIKKIEKENEQLREALCGGGKDET